MKGIVKGDKVLGISEKKGNIKIGTPPKGVGLERLRWDAKKKVVIDLATLSQIWVRHLSGDAFDLHATEQPGAQLVDMAYQDRKRLTLDNGQIRLKTREEIETEKTNEQLLMLKNRLRKRLDSKNGDPQDHIADAFKLIFMLIVFVRLKPASLADFFDAIIPNIKDTYPEDLAKATLTNIVKELKTEMADYYQEKEEIKNPLTEAATASVEASVKG